ncbi:hypothetical protein BC831DRAFT_470798 [Entophlyctis helioformis]|nr:hypothetical protein BC831DRAFT_470798 [Entophlyctis helioformis]
MASAEQQATTAAQAAEAAEAAEAVETAAAVAEAHDAAPGVTETGTAAESRTAASSATLIRIKRKRNEDPLDTLLVAESGTDKRLKSVADAKVFRLLESVDLAAFDLQKLDTVRQGSAHTDSLAALAFKDKSFKRMALQRLATPEKRREVIVASKLAEAKAARYKIVTQNRQQLKQGTLNVVDIHRDSGEQDESEADRRRNQLRDEITCNLMPMVREYLSLTEQPQPDSRDVDRRRGKHELGRIAADVESEQHATDANSQDDSDDVYDIYVHDHDLGVASALKSSKVGTLAVKADELAGMFLDENDLSSDSDDDSEDSNGTLHQTHGPFVHASKSPRALHLHTPGSTFSRGLLRKRLSRRGRRGR